MRVKTCVKVFFPMDRAALQRTALCDPRISLEDTAFLCLGNPDVTYVLKRMKYIWMLNNIRKCNLCI